MVVNCVVVAEQWDVMGEGVVWRGEIYIWGFSVYDVIYVTFTII